jgi:hypothetical protein
MVLLISVLVFYTKNRSNTIIGYSIVINNKKFKVHKDFTSEETMDLNFQKAVEYLNNILSTK